MGSFLHLWVFVLPLNDYLVWGADQSSNTLESNVKTEQEWKVLIVKLQTRFTKTVLMMIVELLAISAAFFYGLSGVLVRKGLISDPESSPLSAVFITMLTQFIVMWGLYIFSSPPFHLQALLVFALAGIVAQCIGRTMNYQGISKLGVSKNNTIVGTNPLFRANSNDFSRRSFYSSNLCWNNLNYSRRNNNYSKKRRK